MSTTTLYRAYDAADQLLYVGITDGHPFGRLAQHVKCYSDWTRYVTKVHLTQYSDRGAAAAAETCAIRDEDPVWNIHGRPIERRTQWQIAYPGKHADDITAEDIEQHRRELDQLCVKALRAMDKRIGGDHAA